MAYTRRKFLKHGGAGLLTFYLGGCEVELTPAKARQKKADLQVLSASEVRNFEALADILLPGSAAAGVAYFVDHQLAQPAGNELLLIRYLGVHPPFTGFYKSGIAALNSAALTSDDIAFADLDEELKRGIANQMAAGKLIKWTGPPSQFFFFVLRADAIDVMYGTKTGFDNLNIPYMAHIDPPSRWGE